MIASGNITVERPHRVESPAARLAPSRALLATAVALLGVFTVADVFSRGIVLSVLYAVPLVLVAWAGYHRALRWVTVALVVIVYAVFFGKWAMYAPPGSSPFNFALVNRTLVVVSLCLLEVLLKMRVSTECLRGDVELSESLRHEEDEIDETLAILMGVALTSAIALADFLSPANYNFAILYTVPLFLCAWTRFQRLLWGTLAVALLLSVLGFICGPPMTSSDTTMTRMVINRVLSGLVLALLAVLLHFQIDGRVPSRFGDARRQSGNPI